MHLHPETPGCPKPSGRETGKKTVFKLRSARLLGCHLARPCLHPRRPGGLFHPTNNNTIMTGLSPRGQGRQAPKDPGLGLCPPPTTHSAPSLPQSARIPGLFGALARNPAPPSGARWGGQAQGDTLRPSPQKDASQPRSVRYTKHSFATRQRSPANSYRATKPQDSPGAWKPSLVFPRGGRQADPDGPQPCGTQCEHAAGGGARATGAALPRCPREARAGWGRGGVRARP